MIKQRGAALAGVIILTAVSITGYKDVKKETGSSGVVEAVEEEASDSSDVDLLISSNITGLNYYELAERLRDDLHKKVDLLDSRQLLNNEELLDEILKEGIRIYG